MSNAHTSPIPPSVLAAVLGPGLPSSRTLPAEAYTSHDVFNWEIEHFFESGWICVGRAEELSHAGDQRAFAVGDGSVLVVRDAAGHLNAFHNTCRHRGHELVEPGVVHNLHAIKCPYHAWVYGLDGRLKGAPRFRDVPSFAASDYPLIATSVTEWRGWIFVNPSGDAPPFHHVVGNLDELLEPWEPERLFVAASHDYVVRANWKTITENYHECYHCPSIHPELCAVTSPDSGENSPHDGLWVGGSMQLKEFAATMSFTGASGGVPMRGLDARRRREVYYVGLFPNLLISLHPDYVMTHRLEPLGPGETRVECHWLFPPEVRSLAEFSPNYAAEFWDVTNREDWVACESVSRGLRSAGFRQGPFAWSEDEVHAFMAMVALGYLDGFASPPQQVPSRDEATAV